MVNRRGFQRLICGVPVLLLTGCFTWQPAQTVPQVFLAPDNPRRPVEIRVRTRANHNVRLASPSMSGDTLVGTVPGRRPTERRIPLDSVSAVQTYRFSGGATAGRMLLFTFLTVAVLAVVYLASFRVG